MRYDDLVLGCLRGVLTHQSMGYSPRITRQRGVLILGVLPCMPITASGGQPCKVSSAPMLSCRRRAAAASHCRIRRQSKASRPALDGRGDALQRPLISAERETKAQSDSIQ